jgi:hypothetical protein
MKLLPFFILFYSSLFAQTDYTFKSLYRTFKEGTSCFILKDKSKIYAAPSFSSPDLAVLPAGLSISVNERMDEVSRVDGFRTNWYRVSLVNKGDKMSGFLWGGNIAAGSFRSVENPEVSFFYGMDKIVMADRGNYSEESIYLVIAACQNGKMLHQLQFEAIGTLYTKTQGAALGNKGLFSIQDVIEISFSDGYCGGVSASVTIFWDGRKMHFIDLLSNGFSPETFANKFFIYPDDSDGKSRCVLLRDEAGSFGEDKRPVYSQQIDKTFRWDGEKLFNLDY